MGDHPSLRVSPIEQGMIYTAWGGDDGFAHTLIPGEGPPRFADGSLQPDCTQLVWTIQADSWDDAKSKYSWLHGWSEKSRP
jgi:hypothetical protein